MSEEEDYMSDKFLTGLQNVKSSLINNRAKKRAIEVESKSEEHKKNQKVSKGKLDNESLQMALSKPLPRENKGFKLLEKMGYKPGQTLGKAAAKEGYDGNCESRLIVPIGIVLKTDRQGLGREAAIKELNAKRREIRQQRLKKELGGETSVEDFRRRTNQKHEEKFVLNSLRRCQVTCENLDLESSIDKPELSWFWMDKTTETEENNTDESDDKVDINEPEEIDEFSNQEKLEMLTSYVRTSYLFCYWCGVRYNDEEDLKDNCPGLTKDDH